MHSIDYSFGAQLLAPDRTRFRFWAPNRQQVSLEIEGRPPRAMQAMAGGWFETEADCGAGSRYRYRVSEDLAVPDPASRLQAGDVHDASVVLDPDAYRWQCTDWSGRPWHETVLYELHPGVLGGYDGIRRQLPALAELGITAIELMPIADFPGARNWGYDGVLPYAPDCAYGTPGQLKALIDAAHAQNIMVFLDVVYNHFGPDGNYLNAYAGDFFRDDIQTPWGQAIDFRRRQVRDYFIENAIWWLDEYRFDGLRFDAVHAISEKDFLEEMAQRIRAAFPPERHIHLVLENDDNSARLLARAPQRLYDAQWNDDMHHVLHVLLTGESEGYYAGYVQRTAERLARGLAEGFVYQGDGSLYPGGEPRGEPSAHLPPTSFVLFLQNHDQIGNRALGERLSVLAEPRALRAATALMLLAPQVPMIFMGEEIGATTPFLYFTSHLNAELAEAVRKGRREEFARFPAFSAPETREKIPDPNAEATFEASVPTAGAAGSAEWRAWYRELLAIRHAHIVPRLEGARALDAVVLGARAVLARWTLSDGAVLTIAVNLDAASVSVEKEPAMKNVTTLFRSSAEPGFPQGSLAPYSIVVLVEDAP